MAEKGTVYWVTGLSGAGKTTVGTILHDRLKARSPNFVRLDGDQLREVISNSDYSRAGRKGVAYQYAKLCRLLSSQGINVVICTISMYDELRAWNRENIENYCEIYLKVPFEVLVARDQKGLYSKALRLDGANVVGIDISFEEPKHPDVAVLNDGSRPPEEVAASILEQIERGPWA